MGMKKRSKKENKHGRQSRKTNGRKREMGRKEVRKDKKRGRAEKKGTDGKVKWTVKKKERRKGTEKEGINRQKAA
jgi:hypothetical protein